MLVMRLCVDCDVVHAIAFTLIYTHVCPHTPTLACRGAESGYGKETGCGDQEEGGAGSQGEGGNGSQAEE